MKAEKILFIDTETGGIDPSINSLLSIGFVVWREFEIIDTKEILINDGILNATPEALRINGINLEAHSIVSLPSQLVIEEIDSFLNLHFKEGEKITLAGHNVNFDVNFFKHFLLRNKYSFNNKFSHRTVDTSTILYYLYLAGKIKKKAISSSEAFDFFNIVVQERHTALGDALATAQLFTLLLTIISKHAKIKSNGLLNMPNLFD